MTGFFQRQRERKARKKRRKADQEFRDNLQRLLDDSAFLPEVRKDYVRFQIESLTWWLEPERAGDDPPGVPEDWAPRDRMLIYWAEHHPDVDIERVKAAIVHQQTRMREMYG